MDKIECFKIQLLECDDIFDVTKGKVIKQINCDSKAFIKEPTIILADPFLFVKDDVLFLFYEDKKMYKPAVISMICTKDLENWTDPRVVLKESFHLSYPWVFEDKGQVYMIPETCEFKSIRVYKANNDLTQFEFYKTILTDDREYEKGFSFSDTSIHKFDNMYYLFTTINDGEKNILELYVSENIFDGFVKHPCFPIIENNKYGRNAGGLIKYNGKQYRVAQDCEKKYGEDVHLLEINCISKDEYIEDVYKKNLLAGKTQFYKKGGHQYNYVEFNGKNIVATDAKEYHYFIVSRFLYKLGLLRV